jgi:nucleotide-binding universal stress UspA family protein
VGTIRDEGDAMKILLPVDGSEYTKRMLGYVAAHDELFGPGHDYTVFTAVPPVPVHATRFLDRGALDAYYQEQADGVLNTVRAYANQKGWKVQTRHAVGEPAPEIAALAKSGKFELVVMGTRGQGALGTMILGSVSNGVLARCDTPVLLIR